MSMKRINIIFYVLSSLLGFLALAGWFYIWKDSTGENAVPLKLWGVVYSVVFVAIFIVVHLYNSFFKDKRISLRNKMPLILTVPLIIMGLFSSTLINPFFKYLVYGLVFMYFAFLAIDARNNVMSKVQTLEIFLLSLARTMGGSFLIGCCMLTIDAFYQPEKYVSSPFISFYLGSLTISFLMYLVIFNPTRKITTKGFYFSFLIFLFLMGGIHSGIPYGFILLLFLFEFTRRKIKKNSDLFFLVMGG